MLLVRLRPLQLRSSPENLLQVLHVHRPFATLTTLASPTKRNGPTTPGAEKSFNNSTSSRTALIARHFSSTTHQTNEMAQLPISEKGYHSKAPSVYTTRKVAAPNTLEHRIYIEKDGVPVSSWHDIPLYANEQQTILNMIVEIPRWTNGKLEVHLRYYCRTISAFASRSLPEADRVICLQIAKEEPLNPIKQDVKKGKLRFVRNCFPHHGYLWNYGAFPQVRLLSPATFKMCMSADDDEDMGRPQRCSPRDQSQR